MPKNSKRFAIFQKHLNYVLRGKPNAVVSETFDLSGISVQMKDRAREAGDVGKLCSIIKVNMFIPYIYHPDRHLAPGN